MVKTKWLWALLALQACAPDTEGGAALIDSPRVLALRSDPPEAEPGQDVEWNALFVGPKGVQDGEELDWALCTQRKPLTTAGPIALPCLARKGKHVERIGLGEMVAGKLPEAGCSIFGPSPAAAEADAPASRPADPDSSGGYYQILRVLIPDTDNGFAVGSTRLSCGLRGATQEQAVDYAERYRPNRNPEIDTLIADPRGDKTELAADSAFAVKRGKAITFRARWAECPTRGKCGDGICSPNENAEDCSEDCKNPVGCTGSEPFVQLDPIAREVVARRESIRVSWFATDGVFEHDRSGRAEEEAAINSSDNTWTAPMKRGAVHLWLVLRDNRGGVAYQSYQLEVN